MNNKEWAQKVAEKIKKKELSAALRNKGKIPYTAENGVFDDQVEKNIYWWTNGFWGGMMWQLYNADPQEIYKENALFTEDMLDQTLMSAQHMDHDSGFRWLPTALADYRITHSEKAYNRAMLAADNLAGRFNPAGSFIKAWNDNGDGSRAGWAIIDCMMNLPLLYWAYEERNDPRYLEVAVMHANTAMKYFVREDGSVNHIVEFDPVTGAFVRSYGGQGYKQGSAWTRGQAWALYGFTLSYIHTGKKEYLETAKKVAAYFMAHIPENGLIPVDFCQPSDCTWLDDTAAAIAACGLIELAGIADSDNDKYMNAAMKMLHALDENDCNYDENHDNILEKCTAAYSDKNHEFPIIYGDYYYIEAIWKLTGDELFIW